MTKLQPNEKDVRRKHKQCAYCSEKFGKTEFKIYKSNIGTSIVTCLECKKKNHINPSEDSITVLVRLVLSWGVGLAIALPGIAYYLFAAYSAFNIGTGISTFGLVSAVLVFSIVLAGHFMGRYLNHVLIWQSATFSRQEDLPMMQFISDEKTTQSNNF